MGGRLFLLALGGEETRRMSETESLLSYLSIESRAGESERRGNEGANRDL